MSGAASIDPFEPFGELQDRRIAMAAFPFGDGCFSEPTAGEENIDGHDEIHPAHADVHSSIPDFVVGNGFDVSWQTGLHVERLLLLKTPSSRPYGLWSITNVNANCCSISGFYADRLAA